MPTIGFADSPNLKLKRSGSAIDLQQ